MKSPNRRWRAVEEGRFYTFPHAVAPDPLSLCAKVAKDGMTAFDPSSAGRPAAAWEEER
jgi:hypothetical protein